MVERISLVEQYDNKDMIVQVKKCRDRTADAVSVSTEARDTAAASAAEAHTASTQAQTAAATVATYESRLGAAEDGVAGNRSSIQTIDGEITDIYNDLTNVVRKVGEAGQVVMNGLDLRGTNRTSDTTVGDLNNLIVNAKRLIEEIDAKLDAYDQMVRTTGNQSIDGVKTFNSSLYTKSITDIGYRLRRFKTWLYNNSVRYKRIYRYTTNSGVMLRLNIIWGFNDLGRYGVGDVLISDVGICKVDYHGTATFGPGGVYVCRGTDGYSYVVVSNMSGYNGVTVELVNSTRYSQSDDIPNFELLTEDATTSPPVVGDDYLTVTQGSAY